MKVAHIADIHIRLVERINEYEKILTKTVDEIKKRKIKHVFLVGDLVHNKTTLSPEQIDLLTKFLSDLSNISTVYIIPGNHDANLTNETRMDSLSPIIKMVKSTKIHYLKDTRDYAFKNFNLSVKSCLDDGDIPKLVGEYDMPTIALYHGIVAGASVDTGYSFDADGDYIGVSDFKDFDFVFLGDIHKYQTFRKNKTMAYCGSLIQQDHGESVDKGFLVWDLEKKTHERVIIENDSGFYDLMFNDLFEPQEPFPPAKSHIRIVYPCSRENIPPDVKSTILSVVKENFTPATVVQKYTKREKIVDSEHDGDYDFLNVYDWEIQKKLIKEWIISSNTKCEGDVLKSIMDIDKEIHDSVMEKTNINPDCVQWEINKVEVKNFLSHKNTTIPFSDKRGVIGIFGKNRSGKSVVIDAILYALFGKISRQTKSMSDILNDCVPNADSYGVKLYITIDGIKYKIDRETKVKSDGSTSSRLIYFKHNDEKWVKEVKDDKLKTEKHIKSILGEYDDFVLSVVSTQGGLLKYIDYTPAPRAKAILRYLGFEIFDKKHSAIKKILNSMGDPKHDLSEEIDLLTEYEKLLKKDKLKLKEMNVVKKDLLSKIEKVKNEVYELKLSKKQVEIEDSVEDIVEIMVERKREANNLYVNNEKTKKSLIELNREDNTIVEVDEEKHALLRDERSNLVGEQSDTQTKIKQCDSFIRLNSTKFECPTCDDERSLKCKYVAEQNEIDEKLKEAGELLIGLNSSRDSLKLKIKELQVQMKKMSDDYENNTTVRSRLASIENTKEKIDNQVDKLDVMIAGYTLLEAKLEKAKKETDIHEHNEKIDDEIRSYKETVDSLSYNFSSIEEDIIELVSDIGGHKKGIENKKDIIDNIRKDIGLHKVYRLYEKIMHRENLPLWLLNRYIPVINQQISDILMSFVDFNVRFELDERKELQIIYSYSESDGRYVGMASGMEKMIIALSIRIVMTLISNISRPNMWIIDEGFSSLDDDQRTNMVGLMSMLRDMFNNVIIITHIDQIKDLVDHQLIAEKTNGVSRIK